MILSDLIDKLAMKPTNLASPGRPVSDLTDDSRQAGPQTVFLARPGTQVDGRDFIEQAIAADAAAIITDPATAARTAASHPEANVLACDLDSPGAVSRLAERFFDHPSRKLKLIGVTGTNGKTTVAWLTQYLLKQFGIHAGMIGTVTLDDGQDRTVAQLTTPGAIDFSRLLHRMVQHGCQAAVAEVSSHALDQQRVAALQFDVAVFTNLTGDHLDYHGSMENYAAAKARLFALLDEHGAAVVSAEDPYTPTMLANCPASQVFDCSVLSPRKRPRNGHEATAQSLIGQSGTWTGADRPGHWQVRHHECLASARRVWAGGSEARFEGPWGSALVDLPLVGEHNLANAVQAAAATHAVAEVTGQALATALAHAPAPPGRLEPIRYAHGPSHAQPVVLVDYAHTHDALENVLAALRPLTPRQRRLIVLFGCGGDRDRTKRPKMAQVACELADRVIISSDNPRTEDPKAIIRDVLTGLPRGTKVALKNSTRTATLPEPRVWVEPDRAQAIKLAIAMARDQDVILLAGKGHEDYQILGQDRIAFDDREHAGRALAQWWQTAVDMTRGAI